MAHLSDDDVPTMTGTPGSLAEEPEDSGDTTSADSSVPVAAAIHAAAEAAAAKVAAATPHTDDEDDETAGHDAEDRTVQQKVTTPGLARPSRPDAPSPPTTGPSTLLSAPGSGSASAGTPSSNTAPGTTGPPTYVASPPTVASATSSSSGSSGPSTDPSGAPTSVDADELEDSVTATAPRIPASNLNITVPGAVEIRTVDHDELLDETEVKTMANLPPELQRAIKNARQDANAPQPSQPPPPPRPAAGAPPVPSMPVVTKPSRDVDLAGTAPTPHAAALAETVVATELDSDELAPDSSEDVLPADEESVTAQSLAPATRPGSTAEPETSKTGGDVVAAALALVEVDEPPTRPGVEGDASATDDPPTRPGLLEPETRPGIGEPPTSPRGGDPPTSPRPGDPITYPRVGDVPTSKRVEVRASAETELDDSITTLAPKLSADLIAAAVAKSVARPGSKPPAIDDDDDSTDGLTTKVKRSKLDPSDAPTSRNNPDSPADGESESITTQAPGPLTNILRVIAADKSSPGDDSPIEDDEPEENRTAVMANAPLINAANQQLASRSSGLSVPTQMGIGPRAVAAPQLNPTSESGLRVARPGSGSGERMSAGHISAVDPRISGIARSAMPGDSGQPHGLALANTELAFPPGSTPQPSLHDVDLGKGPRYGLLVGIVAIVSFVVPVTLFLVLRGDGDARTPVTPNEPAADFQKHDGPRPKLEKGKKPPPADPSATPSGSASAKPGAGKFGFGGGRR